jgi:hypothetical protein
LYGSIATIILAVVFTGLNFICLLFFQGCFMKWSINNYNSPDEMVAEQRTLIGEVHSSLKAFPAVCHLTKRLYSTTAVKGVKELELSPFWVTGFADAESCFSLKVSKKTTIISGWNVIPEFKIELHSRDLILLRKIHSFFGVGTIYEREDRNIAYYSVQSVRDINNVIIPHFDKYPLITQKKADYLLFKQAINLLNLKARSNIEGIQNIISIKASMNTGLSDSLKINFSNTLPVPRPVVSFEGIPHLNWLIGFVDGEGYFYVKLVENKNYSTGFSVGLVFSISQHVRDEVLFTKLIDYLGCGKIERASSRPNGVTLVVYKFIDIKEKVIPLFQSYPLQGIKFRDYQDFVKVANIMENKGHLTLEGLKKIKSLRSGMNKGRI